jgi:hypothetical protein
MMEYISSHYPPHSGLFASGFPPPPPLSSSM